MSGNVLWFRWRLNACNSFCLFITVNFPWNYVYLSNWHCRRMKSLKITHILNKESLPLQNISYNVWWHYRYLFPTKSQNEHFMSTFLSACICISLCYVLTNISVLFGHLLRTCAIWNAVDRNCQAMVRLGGKREDTNW